MLSRFRPAFPALGLLVLLAGAVYAQAFETLSIAMQGGQRQSFRVEVARNDADRAQGLMFRRSMPADQGMLFDFGRIEPVAMWMQNTYLPLDMLFIRADGSIARIAVNTVPHSTESVLSGEPVAAVLELAGGRSVELGIKEGDLVTWQVPSAQ